ncbi:MAG TPA: hypothetical protein ENI87_03200 [bacterium]|nr:hypothetical protein [bacterium]
MRRAADSFWSYLDVPLAGRVRLFLLILIVPLLLSFMFPLWRISMEAPQYPNGLSMDIYSYKLEGGHGGLDIKEINVLNHYIGMHAITRDELQDLDWLPFGILAMALLAMRAALLGNVRTLIDLSMISAYISAVAFGRFIYMLYEFGFNLDPKAPVTVEPFMPVIIGSKKIANFWTHSMPQLGSVLMGVFTMGVWGLTLWCLWRGRKEATSPISA